MKTKKLTLILIAIFSFSALNPLLYSHGTTEHKHSDEVIESCNGCGCADKKVEKKACDKAKECTKAEAKKTCCGKCDKAKKSCSAKKECAVKKSCEAKKACGSKCDKAKKCTKAEAKKACCGKCDKAKKCTKAEAKKACCGSCPKAAAKAGKSYNADIVKQLKGGLQNAKGEKVSADVVGAKKYTLVYYSAHWCPPCRKFTPELVKWYNADHKDYEVVFVSSDKNNEKMLKYMSETKMPWVGTVKGSDAEKALQKFQNGRGIPCLILLDENGKRISSSYNDQGKYTGPATAYKHLQTLLKK